VHSVSRTYGQFVALQGKIAEANKNKLVPVLPEPPHPTHKDDAVRFLRWFCSGDS